MQAQTSSRRRVERIKEVTKTESAQRKSADDRLKKTVSTPRNYLQKSTTADIYGSNKPNLLQAPRKGPSSSNSARNVSPMKSYLKSTPSTVSVGSPKMAADRKIEAKLSSARKVGSHTTKSLARTNVTVNSPIIKRSNSDLKKEKTNLNDVYKNRDVNSAKSKSDNSKSNMADVFLRQRSKTRTLDENEVKVFKSDVVDNNAEMQKLTRTLSAKPKSFYVDLNGDQAKKEKETFSEEEEVSYEDDFESYESDFESYHSESQSDRTSSPMKEDKSSDENDGELEANSSLEDKIDRVKERSAKDNEENMLDSGSYDLRDPQRSGQKVKPAPLDFIMEVAEGADKKPSLTDEGFQEMSTSSGAPSMKTVHVDILDRPLFMDFTVLRRNRRKRRIFQQLRERAMDILSMITLHEMTYTLFEMNPIPYDLYMATFGRSNCAQIAVQTFDDGVEEESQTEHISNANKWTQCPVRFSKSDVHLNMATARETDDALLTKFSLLINERNDERFVENDDSYKRNPLRIYLEQKDGVGSDRMLPVETYKNKLKQTDYNVNRLKKFLKKVESRISDILSVNAGNAVAYKTTKSSKFPFSKGLINIPVKNAKMTFVDNLKVSNVIFSRSKTNLILTIHDKSNDSLIQKCVMCLWDLCAVQEPIKVLIATENVAIGRFSGGHDGVVVAALEDGSLHLWDLSEEATWIQDNSVYEKSTDLVEIDENTKEISQTELDREWNLKNSRANCGEKVLRLMQSSAYTNSGVNVVNGDSNDCVTGLDFMGDCSMHARQDGGRKVIAQICSLQRVGVLTVWSIVQQKNKNVIKEIGKAFWSKLALEMYQTINLSDHLYVCVKDGSENNDVTFNLNAAKKRMTNKRRENKTPRPNCRSKSADARPRSVASVRVKKELQPQINNQNAWETGIVCNDLRVMRMNNVDNFLIAKNCGELLCCTRHTGSFNVKRICVANDTSSVTRLELSQNGLPYILAATDCGAVNLCSMLQLRVLLTLDCMNRAPDVSEKYKTDHKGRYIGSVSTNSTTSDVISFVKDQKVAVTSLAWSRSNPFDFFALLGDGTLYAWRLTKSDICPRKVDVDASVCIATADNMALVTSQNEVQIHRLHDKQEKENLELYQRYVALL